MTNHNLFKKHLKESQDSVHAAADWLREKGFQVQVPKCKVAPNRDEWRAYVDFGDLLVSFRAEVKALSAEFSCRDDWPFGNAAIVCAKHAWDQANLKPFVFFQFNRQRTHAAIIWRKTISFWFVEKRKDRRYTDVIQEFYLCPLKYVEFRQIYQQEGTKC